MNMVNADGIYINVDNIAYVQRWCPTYDTWGLSIVFAQGNVLNLTQPAAAELEEYLKGLGEDLKDYEK